MIKRARDIFCLYATELFDEEQPLELSPIRSEMIFEEDDLLFGWQLSGVAESHKSSSLSFDSFDKHTE